MGLGGIEPPTSAHQCCAGRVSHLGRGENVQLRAHFGLTLAAPKDPSCHRFVVQVWCREASDSRLVAARAAPYSPDP